MTAAKVTITMLGGSDSGKTVFLHAMYAEMSAGVERLSLLTVDPDRDTDMMEVWTALKQRAKLPPVTGDNPQSYQFWLKDGFDTIADVDMVDFRGQAMVAGSGQDAPRFRDRLAASDCIVVVLNGSRLWPLVAGLDTGRALSELDLDDEDADYAEEIRQLNVNVRRAVDTRRKRGQQLPALVLLVTKADRLVPLSGLTLTKAMDTVESHLPKLVRVVQEPGVTALVCPVTVGNIGEKDDPFPPSAVRPRHVERPLLFALVQLLEAEIERRSANLPEVTVPPPTGQPSKPAPTGIGRELFEAVRSVLAARRAPAASRAAGPSADEVAKQAAAREAELAAIAEVRDLTTRLRGHLKGMTVLVAGKPRELR